MSGSKRSITERARPLLLLVALAIVLVLASRLMQMGREPRRAPAEAIVPIALRGAESTADGALLLRWEPYRQADRYEIWLFDESGSRFARRGAERDGDFVLRREHLAALDGHILQWQVVALRADRIVAESKRGTLYLP